MSSYYTTLIPHFSPDLNLLSISLRLDPNSRSGQVYHSDSDSPTKNPTLGLRSVYQSDSLLIGAASFLRNPTHAEAAHPYFQLLLFSTFSMQAPAFNTPYFPSFSSFPLLQHFHACWQLPSPFTFNFFSSFSPRDSISTSIVHLILQKCDSPAAGLSQGPEHANFSSVVVSAPAAPPCCSSTCCTPLLYPCLCPCTRPPVPCTSRTCSVP